MEGEYNFHTKDSFEPSGNFQSDLYQIIKLEVGEYFEEKYEEYMDELALSSSYNQIQYYENCSQVIRRCKMPLKDKKITSLQNYTNDKRKDLRDGLMSVKDAKHLSIAIDCLEKCNKNILQLTYNIMQEVKEGVLKKSESYYNLINLYYAKKISKSYASFQEFVEDTFQNLDKEINLVYGGYFYGKKH